MSDIQIKSWESSTMSKRRLKLSLKGIIQFFCFESIQRKYSFQPIWLGIAKASPATNGTPALIGKLLYCKALKRRMPEMKLNGSHPFPYLLAPSQAPESRDPAIVPTKCPRPLLFPAAIKGEGSRSFISKYYRFEAF